MESARASSGGDPVLMAALLRTANLESGFGCAGGISMPQGNGGYTFNIQTAVPGSTAFGTTQFTQTTWNDVISRDRVNIRADAQRALANTTDAALKSQYTAFIAYLDGNGAPANFRYYAGMTGPSVIMANSYARLNGAISAMPTVAAAAPDVNAYAVASYIGHNGGKAELNAIVAALQSGRGDVPVDQILQPITIRNNPSIWCARTSSGACQPLTVRQALANIDQRGVSGSCVQQAFQMAGLPISTAGMPNLPPGTYLSPMVSAAEEKPEPYLEIMDSGGAAGKNCEGAFCDYLYDGVAQYEANSQKGRAAMAAMAAQSGPEPTGPKGLTACQNATSSGVGAYCVPATAK